MSKAPAASASGWDLTALLNAAAHATDPKAPLPERNLWIVRALEWLRHVTLSTGQLAAAAEGWSVLRHAPFWWCVAGIAVTGVLNLTVSFFLAFKVAMRSRGIRLADRSRIRHAILKRLRSRPGSFVLPPKLSG